MLTRRAFIQTSVLLTGGMLMGCSKGDSKETINKQTWFMPDESEEHLQTWMSFVANDYIWESTQIPVVKEDLARIARTIAKYEPVSMLVAPHDKDEAKSLLGEGHNFPISLVTFETDDLWLRDTAPTFVLNEAGEKACINFNFNGWGNDQEHTLDKHVANFIAQESQTQMIHTELVLEGGCFEVDGKGNAIMTESCIVNDNRNPTKSKDDIEEELKTLLGLEKVIWLKGIKGEDITDGHTDFYARFVNEGEVLVSRDNYKESHDYEVTRENIAIFESATDNESNPYTLHLLDTPNEINAIGTKIDKEDDFAAGYIGYYLCNGAVIMQKFGDAVADKKAYETLKKLFPSRVIEQIRIDGIASGGGSIHCATQQEPKG